MSCATFAFVPLFDAVHYPKNTTCRKANVTIIIAIVAKSSGGDLDENKE